MSKSKIQIKSLFKVFGNNPQGVMDLVNGGISKQELLENHGHVLGLRDINIDVPEKCIRVIMGLSGSGKSTLIRHINRLIEPTSGQVLVDEEDVLAMSDVELKNFRRRKLLWSFKNLHSCLTAPLWKMLDMDCKFRKYQKPKLKQGANIG